MPRKRVVGRHIKTTVCTFLLADVKKGEVKTVRRELVGTFTKAEINAGKGDKFFTTKKEKFIHCKSVKNLNDYYYLTEKEFFELSKRIKEKEIKENESNSICKEEI